MAENKVEMIHSRQHHILEDVLIRWDIEEQYRNPFREYFVLLGERIAKRDGHQYEYAAASCSLFPDRNRVRNFEREQTEIWVKMIKQYLPLVPGDRAIFIQESTLPFGSIISPFRLGSLRSPRHNNETFSVPSDFFVPENPVPEQVSKSEL